MKKTLALFLVLLLVVVGSVFFRRSPLEERPSRKTRPPEVEIAPPPAPAEPVAVVVEPPPPAKPPAQPVPPPPPQVPPPVVPPSAKPGIIRGAVTTTAQRPRAKVIPMSDPGCAARHAQPPLVEDLVIGEDGGVKWAFVYVKSGINGQPPAPLQVPVTIDQVGCVYTPRVAGVQVGQPLVVLNSDELLHNVHGMPFANKEFNVGLPSRGMEGRWTFRVPEVMVRVKCDVHPWMTAWVGVLDHPYFSVSDGTGSYGIPALPPGRYTVAVWHEKFATVEREIDLPPGSDVVLDFLLDAKK